MNRARVRSLYDSEAVLRQAAALLHPLGWSDSSTRVRARTPGDSGDVGQRHEVLVARQASLLAALRRSREILDVIARTLQARAALEQRSSR